jgi:pantetheine-phosphate adenylyltransferase|tara:strand:+ start:587 stop:1084 length:498 start_codon:yes stop_codon:yes gene_type:complete
MKNKTAVFAGSFDPITLGHIGVIESGLKLFDEIIVAIGINEKKKYMFSLDKRKEMTQLALKNKKGLIIKTYKGLTVDFCKQENATHIIRGLRNQHDFEHEKSIAIANHELDSELETCFVLSKKEHAFISSTITREIILNKTYSSQIFMQEKLAKFIPKEIIQIVV